MNNGPESPGEIKTPTEHTEHTEFSVFRGKLSKDFGNGWAHLAYNGSKGNLNHCLLSSSPAFVFLGIRGQDVVLPAWVVKHRKDTAPVHPEMLCHSK
jgi:hypothetical protein